MKRYSALGHRLPIVKKSLFGDRAQFGLLADRSDPMWAEWEDVCTTFYNASQRAGFGKTVNSAGYRVLGKYDFSGKTVMEVGPGYAPHLSFFDDMPEKYVLVDVREEFLENTAAQLRALGVNCELHLIDPTEPHKLPLEAGSIDAIVTFYALEHLYPLPKFVSEYRRVLRKGGHIVGSIPAEGGLAWGLGRFLTTRRWLNKNTEINPDKLICWEHPNFADHILETLEKDFELSYVDFWPMKLPLIDINLVASFIGELKEAGSV